MVGIEEAISHGRKVTAELLDELNKKKLDRLRGDSLKHGATTSIETLPHDFDLRTMWLKSAGTFGQRSNALKEGKSSVKHEKLLKEKVKEIQEKLKKGNTFIANDLAEATKLYRDIVQESYDVLLDVNLVMKDTMKDLENFSKRTKPEHGSEKGLVKTWNFNAFMPVRNIRENVEKIADLSRKEEDWRRTVDAALDGREVAGSEVERNISSMSFKMNGVVPSFSRAGITVIDVKRCYKSLNKLRSVEDKLTKSIESKDEKATQKNFAELSDELKHFGETYKECAIMMHSQQAMAAFEIFNAMKAMQEAMIELNKHRVALNATSSTVKTDAELMKTFEEDLKKLQELWKVNTTLKGSHKALLENLRQQQNNLRADVQSALNAFNDFGKVLEAR